MSANNDYTTYFQAVSFPENPMASLVIPVYNMREWLPLLVQDLFALETLLPYEVIFVDNNSSDGSVEFLESIGARVEKAELQGVNFARQKGLELAKGEVVVSMDPDSAYPVSFVDDMVLPLFRFQGYSMTWMTTIGSQRPHQPSLQDRLKLAIKRCVHALTFDQLAQAKKARAHAMAFRKDSGIYYPVDVVNMAGCDDGLIAVQLMRKGKFYRLSKGMYTAAWSGKRIQAHSRWPKR